MDSESQDKLDSLRSQGKPETTQGPFYHKAWWEAYKGDAKGTLGGLIIGGAVGVLIGGAALGMLALTGIAVEGAVALTLAASAAFGMYKGATKFANVGVTAGAVAATQEVAEVRMKEYVRERFREVRNEIRELKTALTGKKTELLPEDHSPVLKPEDFRTTHCDEHCENRKVGELRRYIYPMVTAIGAAVGAIAGALLGVTGSGEYILHHVLNVELTNAAAASLPLATAATGAAIGASFGISRDWFRAVFDVTDRWFMGVITPPEKEKGKAPTRTYNLTAPLPMAEQKQNDTAKWAAPTQRVLMSPSPDVTLTESPILSATHHREKLANAARQALLGMDHTTAMRQ